MAYLVWWGTIDDSMTNYTNIVQSLTQLFFKKIMGKNENYENVGINVI